MPRRLLALVVVVAMVVVVACQQGRAAPPSPSPSVAPTPTSAALRAPAAAILADSDVGLPRVSGADHLTAAQVAAAAPDQVLALQQMTAWGWLDASQRGWGAGGQVAVSDFVVLTIRADGGRRAFADLSVGADAAPFAGGPCGGQLGVGLDECHYASDGSSAIVVGRLDAEVFRLQGSVADVGRLTPLQTGRLRA